MAKQTRQNQFCGPSDPSQASLGTWSQFNSQSCSEAFLSSFLNTTSHESIQRLFQHRLSLFAPTKKDRFLIGLFLKSLIVFDFFFVYFL